jgi:hypothetical protein
MNARSSRTVKFFMSCSMDGRQSVFARAYISACVSTIGGSATKEVLAAHRIL